MTPSFREDDRGLAIGIIGFVAIIVIAAFLYTLLDPAASSIFPMLDSQTTNTQADAVIDERQTIWHNALFAALFIGTLGIIARAIAEQRRPG